MLPVDTEHCPWHPHTELGRAFSGAGVGGGASPGKVQIEAVQRKSTAKAAAGFAAWQRYGAKLMPRRCNAVRVPHCNSQRLCLWDVGEGAHIPQPGGCQQQLATHTQPEQGSTFTSARRCQTGRRGACRTMSSDGSALPGDIGSLMGYQHSPPTLLPPPRCFEVMDWGGPTCCCCAPCKAMLCSVQSCSTSEGS